MAQMIIRGIEEEVMIALKERAKRANRSLQKEVHQILTQSVAPLKDNQALYLQLKKEHAKLLKARKGKPFSDSVALLRADRDSHH